MAKNGHWGAFIFGMIVGAVAGTGVALLFTPRSGEELREELLNQTQGVQGRVQTLGSQVQGRTHDVSSQVQTRVQGIGSQVQTRVQTVGSQVQSRSQGLIEQGKQVVQRGGESMEKSDAADTDFAGTPPESRSPIVEDASDANLDQGGMGTAPDNETIETPVTRRAEMAPSEADRNAAKQKAEGVKPKDAPDYAPIQPESEVEQVTKNLHDKANDRTKKPDR